MENVGRMKSDPHDSTGISGGISSIVSEEVESESQETGTRLNKTSNANEENKKNKDDYNIENGDGLSKNSNKVTKNEKIELSKDSPTITNEKTNFTESNNHFDSSSSGHLHTQALDQAQSQTSNIIMQQHHVMDMNQHVNTLNLVAHYEAQMRDHLAAFSQAAAGAAWAAAQAASMPTSTIHLGNSSPYPGPNLPLSPGMPYTTPPGQMSMQIPVNNMNFPTIPSPFSPRNIHPIPMHHPPPHTEQPWQIPHQDQYQKDKQSQIIFQQQQPQQQKQRNRGRNDQNVGNQNHPNKRHQKMQEQQHNEEEQQEASINTQLQQMQFQSPTHQPFDETPHFIHSHSQITNNSMDVTAATNKRRHSSSTTWQVPFLHTKRMELEKISHHPQQYIVDPNDHNNQKNMNSSSQLWSSNQKIDDKTTSHKSYENSSSPSMLKIQRNNLFLNNSKQGNNNKQSNNASTVNKSNTRLNRSNRNARNANNKATRRRLRSSVDSAHSNSSCGGSHSNSSNKTPRKSKNNKKRSSNNQSANNSPRPFNPTGKTGVMALHELCSKRHWPPPKFVEIQQIDSNSPNSSSNNNNGEIITSSSQSTYPSRTSVLLTNSFLISVIVQERELGRGRGGTKAAAKQDAARQALSVLLPNIAFDHNGILIQVGTKQMNQSVTTSIKSSDELAPLASKLAIHQNQSNGSSPSVECKPPNINPCSSSGLSSADEDENSYYASRGASVCSTLLHAMWQIDQRIQEPPRYNFEVCSPPIIISSSSYKRTKGDNISYVSSTPVAVHRSSFACTASITLRASTKKSQFTNHVQNDTSLANSKNIEITKTNQPTKPNKLDYTPGAKVKIDEGTDKDKKLEAVGTGATKREAKHIASAKLLALLFPECNGMVEVMGAAEAAREEYAASKALTKQHKRALSQSNSNYMKKKELSKPNESICCTKFSTIKNELWFALPKIDDTVLPEEILLRLQSIIELNRLSRIAEKCDKEQKTDLISHDNFISVAALSISESKENIDAAKTNEDSNENNKLSNSNNSRGGRVMDTEISSKRQMIHQKQIEEEVDNALQKLLESDDENRSCLGGNSIDEAGRIILRRACVYDYEALNNLLSSACLLRQTHAVIDKNSFFANGPASQMEGLKHNERNETNLPSLLWGGISFILVLSRVIAGHDEAPLGCAVLTIQFTMLKGRVLKICDMAHEVHLPRERFLECLEKFALNMQCALDLNGIKSHISEKNTKTEKMQLTRNQLTRHQMKQIFFAYCNTTNTENKESKQAMSLQQSKQSDNCGDISLQNKYPLSNSSLQAVEEEDSEEIEEALKDESGHEELSDQVNSGRNQHKPSKRSRVS